MRYFGHDDPALFLAEYMHEVTKEHLEGVVTQHMGEVTHLA